MASFCMSICPFLLWLQGGKIQTLWCTLCNLRDTKPVALLRKWQPYGKLWWLMWIGVHEKTILSSWRWPIEERFSERLKIGEIGWENSPARTEGLLFFIALVCLFVSQGRESVVEVGGRLNTSVPHVSLYRCVGSHLNVKSKQPSEYRATVSEYKMQAYAGNGNKQKITARSRAWSSVHLLMYLSSNCDFAALLAPWSRLLCISGYWILGWLE